MTNEEAIKKLKEVEGNNLVDTGEELEVYDELLSVALDMAIEALSVEAIQGEWLPRWSEVECSICGEFEKKKSNFCPTCGAKMVERG